jgi:RHS repeat-associated protein
LRYGLVEHVGDYLRSVQDYTGNVNGPVLWNLNLLDARMNAVSETYGNGLWLQNGFDALTGVPLTRQSGTGGQSSNVQNLSYVWDTAGNLSNRQDLRQSITETFTYDALDRLTLASGPAAQSTSIGYDAIGNLTSKTGVGSYTYHATRKHAVVSAGGVSYTYDSNGNMISRSGATVTWSSYNLPTYVADPNGYSAQFWYAPDRSRWKQVSSYSGGNETTIYAGGLLEKLTTATRTHWKDLIATPSGQVQVIRRSDGTTDTFYVTTDHLGSTDAVLNAAGTVLMRGSFGVHGARRASNWQGAPSGTEWQAIADTTRRGYTGHEQIDNVMVVHMSGRVFDPAIGRFLSADPYIDGPETTQGWNRYAYVHGRYMSAVDPSGYDTNYIFDYSRGCDRIFYYDCGVSLSSATIENLRSQGVYGQPADPLFPRGGGSGSTNTPTVPNPAEPAQEAPPEEVVVEAKKCVAGGGASRVDAMIHSAAALSLTINTTGPALDSSMIGSTADRLTAGRMQWAMRAAEGTTQTMGPKLAMFAKRAGAVGMIYTAVTAIEKGGPYYFYAAGDIAIAGGLMLIPPPANFWAVTIYAGSGGLEAFLEPSCD